MACRKLVDDQSVLTQPPHIPLNYKDEEFLTVAMFVIYGMSKTETQNSEVHTKYHVPPMDASFHDLLAV